MNITTPVAPGHRYACWGKPRGGRNTAWLNTDIDIRRYGDLGVEIMQISKAVTTDWLPGCRYDLSSIDPSCAGCPNIGDTL